MSTLYIMGNGFDIAHGLKTSYWYFMEYLEKYAEDFYTEFVSLYGYPPYGPDRFNSKKDEREYYKRRRESEYEALWKDLEHTLGIADEQNMLDFSASTVESLDLESGPVGIEDTLNYYWEEQYGFMTQLNDYLYRWARQIRLFKATPQSDRLLNNTNDCFMTFNYTNTLERIYHIPNANVLHIHGGLPPVCYTKPIIGHGNKAVIDKYRQEAHKADEEFDEGYKSICNAIAKMYKRTYKDTKYNLINLMLWINNHDDIDTVEIIGHSLAPVDLPYFEFLHDHLPETVKWIVYYHDEAQCESLKQAVLNLGVDESLVELRPSDAFWN